MRCRLKRYLGVTTMCHPTAASSLRLSFSTKDPPAGPADGFTPPCASVAAKVLSSRTDTDVARRVLAKRLDPAKVTVGEVMTESPACVSEEGTAFEALSLMVGGRFRHLPVVGTRLGQSQAVGVLDVRYCMS